MREAAAKNHNMAGGTYLPEQNAPSECLKILNFQQ